MSEFGDLLRAIGTRAGLSEWDLSQEIGVGLQTIRDWECGAAKPKVLEMTVLRDVFGDDVYAELVRARTRD